ncbi:MAG: LytR family transcriptional regulator [Actinobacteria bacterium]|nr:MAG: LytR family transcriptional regulator [Actinomycetota bacterium]
MKRRPKAQTDFSRRPKSHYFVLALNVFVSTLLLISGFALLWVNSRVDQRLIVTLNNSKVDAPKDVQLADGSTTGTDWVLDEKSLDAKNFLLTGSDNGSCADAKSATSGGIGDRTSLGERSDTIMIIRIDPSSKRAAILSFPRDLWVNIAGTTRQNRINSAFKSTDPNRLVATIEKSFGIPVDHYVNVNFCAFKEIVTAVDGVKVPFLYPTRDKKTGFSVSEPGCINFDGDRALAYVRSRSGYRYFDTTNQKWLEDPTGDLGRISRQQDFLRRSMQRALDKGSSSLSVANSLLNAALKNVITDDQLTPRGMLDLAQTMRDLNTRTVATYTIESYPKRIGELSVLIPSIKSETMKQILAIFQGRAPLVAQKVVARNSNDLTVVFAAQRIAASTTSTSTTIAAPTTITTVAGPTSGDNANPLQKTVGVVPPDDPSCR